MESTAQAVQPHEVQGNDASHVDAQAVTYQVAGAQQEHGVGEQGAQVVGMEAGVHPDQVGAVALALAEEEELDPNAETGVTDHAGTAITVGQVDAAATKPDDEWTNDEELMLLNLMTNEEYRKQTLGDAHNVYALIALSTSRTCKAVRDKYYSLMRTAAEGMAAGTLQFDEHTAALLQTGHALPMVGAGAGGELLGWDTAALQYSGLTQDQVLALQQQMGLGTQPMTAEQLAAYSAALPMQYGFPVDPSQFQLDANGQLLPEAQQALAAQLALPVAHLQVAPHQPLPQWTGPEKNRNFWKPEEQQELLRLVQDQAYRQQIIGTVELSWEGIAKHLGRGKRSVQRKYDNLKGTAAAAAAAAGATAALPSNDGKKWSPEEVAELMRLVEDPVYLKQTLGLDKPDWRAFGQHFNRSYESVSYKYSYVKNTGRTGAEGKQKHAKARHETSYKEMAIYALRKLEEITGVPEGTSGQICGQIAQNPNYLPQLDTAIVSGKKTLQRWKHGVRSALNAFKMFNKTGAIRDGEVVWRLDTDLVDKESAQAAERAHRQRSKPLSGAARRKIKRTSASEGGMEEEVGPEEGGEESVHETLASMAHMSQRAPSARLAAKRARRTVNANGDTTDDDYMDSEDDEGGPRRKRRGSKASSVAAATAADAAAGMQGLPLVGMDGQTGLTAEQLAALTAGMGGEALTAEQLAALGTMPVLPMMMAPGGVEGAEGAAAGGVSIEVAGQMPYMTMDQYQEYINQLHATAGAEGMPNIDINQLSGLLQAQGMDPAAAAAAAGMDPATYAAALAAASAPAESAMPAGEGAADAAAQQQLLEQLQQQQQHLDAAAMAAALEQQAAAAAAGHHDAAAAMAAGQAQAHDAAAAQQQQLAAVGLEGLQPGSKEEQAAAHQALLATFGAEGLAQMGYDPSAAQALVGLEQHQLAQPPLYVSGPMDQQQQQH